MIANLRRFLASWRGEAAPPSSSTLLLISTARPGRGDMLLAGGVVGLLLVALLAVAPVATRPLPGTASLVLAYLVAVLLCQVLTAALLVGLHAAEPSRPVLPLAAGYLFAGLMIVPWALAFPDAFPEAGIETRLNATATIAAAARLGFPLCVLAYALWPRDRPLRSRRAAVADIAVTFLAVACGVAAFGWATLATDLPLPPFMRDATHIAPLWHVVPPTALALCAAAAAVLARRFGSLLDLWVIVALISLTIEILLLAYLSGGTRLTVGWWAGRLYGLFAAGAVLVALLIGTISLHARHAAAVLAERRARESRLTAVEGISAVVAHELRQPLSGVELSAAAGLRWLRRDPPNLEEVDAALTRIAAVSERAGQVVGAIRSAFRAEGGERVEVDVNAALTEALDRCRSEAAFDRVEVSRHLAPDLPPIRIDPLQLQLVLVNLLRNAIDAMRDVGGRRRALAASTAFEDGRVTIAIRDTGAGLPPEARERLFSGFFTTKPEGMGVGLMFCRTLVETHGGRIWFEAGEPHGAAFHIAFPPA
ncbi:ATP-binding protein [Albimonas sp. CAU 1670]|uniref:ATP-binding protein n=1 Tax=Albimonas sp. CAU 1670 TaxID=3032599 RepID=UPI0023DB68E0|nr:ATP-binding protein [Albimonas sp. CAU 1670]MDF2234100.1 ATP-binding protein [Albimonas sp. CAU 1670]